MRCGTCDARLSTASGSGPDPCPHCAIANAAALGLAAPTFTSPVPGYELLHELGRGAMGVVWLARDAALDRLVALKRIYPGADPQLDARLLREGRAIAQLRHPHIVTIYALGEAS